MQKNIEICQVKPTTEEEEEQDVCVVTRLINVIVLRDCKCNTLLYVTHFHRLCLLVLLLYVGVLHVSHFVPLYCSVIVV